MSLNELNPSASSQFDGKPQSGRERDITYWAQRLKNSSTKKVEVAFLESLALNT